MREDAWLPARPWYDTDFLINTWMAQTEAHEKAHAIERYARYVPELGWRGILSVLTLPGVERHLSALSHSLEMLVARFGDQFIDRIEQEAATSQDFKACLTEIDSSPAFPIPAHLWPRLSAAAGVSIGPMASHMAKLYAEIPDLSRLATWDPHPLGPDDAPELGDAELLEYARAWLIYNEGFWAWEELNRILDEDGPDAAWPLIQLLVERGSDHVLASVGSGILEDLLYRYGRTVMGRVEAQAARDRRFRFCLSHVWRGDMPDHLWRRVVRARGNEPQRG
jgi:hypothetical protein